MNTLITTSRHYYNDGSSEPEVVLYRGCLGHFIPRVGEYIQVWDGWCLERISQIACCVETSEIIITLETSDPNRTYYAEAKKRKIKQWGEGEEND